MVNSISSHPPSAGLAHRAEGAPARARPGAPVEEPQEQLDISPQAASLAGSMKVATTLAASAPSWAGSRLRAYGEAQSAGAPKGSGFDGEA